MNRKFFSFSGYSACFVFALTLFVGQRNTFSSQPVTLPAQRKKEVLTRFSGGEPRTLDPQKADDSPGIQVLQDMFEGMTLADRDGRTRLATAESYTVSKDGKVYTFILRPDAKWSDGSPVTAEQCAFGIRRLVDPKVAAPNAQTAEPILNSIDVIEGKKPLSALGVKALDARTLQLTLAYPLPQFPALLTGVNFSCVNPKNFDSKGDLKQSGKLLTNSAYVLASRRFGDSIELVKNPYYYNAAQVKMQRVVYYTTENTETQINMYLAGQANMTAFRLPSDRISSLKKELGEQVKEVPAYSVLFLHLNAGKPPFQGNGKLRQAISMAIDRNILAKDVFATGETAAYDMVPSGLSGYTPYVYDWAKEPRALQIQQAKALYAEAGYSAKRPFVVYVKYNTNPDLKKVAIAIAAMLREHLGIVVKLENQEFRSFVSSIEAGDYEISINRWNATYPDPSQFLDLLFSTNPQNLSKMKDPVYDALLIQARAEADPVKRNRLFEKAAARGLNNYTVVPLVNDVQKFLLQPNVKGYSGQDRLLHLYSQDLSI